MRTSSLYSRDDPISAAMRPSPTETMEERNARLSMEAEARRISEQIDEDLRLERERLKRRKGDIKLLLLGQAESGKSTLQKQFQLMYKPNSLDQERISWKTVIYFNIVHSLKHILATLEIWDDTLDDESANSDPNSDPISHDTNHTDAIQPPIPTPLINLPLASGLSSPLERPGTSTSIIHPLDGSNESSSVQISNLRQRLNHLITMDTPLAERLSDGITVSGSGKGAPYVRSGWQARAIENALMGFKSRHDNELKKKKDRLSHEVTRDILVEDVARMLAISVESIKEVWSHPTVKGLILRRRLKLDEWSEFFLNHISRIASPDYVPTTDDILHARIQTMGVTEHVFDVSVNGKAVSWHLFDVGGARGQRHSWVPYFDDATAIIFLAPISPFDQYLDEDNRINRIDDSLQLFKQICSNALLRDTHLVLFLNKIDLLQAKLETGLKVRSYITSFGERSNNYETVVQYFRDHFVRVYKQNDVKRRVLYTHLTSVVDTEATQRVIANITDSILRGQFQSAGLM